MTDVERTLAKMVASLYPPLAEAVVLYDATPPRITAAAPLYGIVQVLELGWGYYQPGVPTGRREANWELTLHGRRGDVLAAQEAAPAALTGHYRSVADGADILVLGSFLAGMRAAARAAVPAGLAETTLTFISEVL